MKKKLVTISLLLASGIVITGCGSLGPVDPGEVKTITIDGGGDISAFNTTPSMEQSETNPYPYNTLETLCKKWEESHKGYKVKINKTSSNGDRGVLLPQLKSKTAAHIIYQNGTVVNTDLGQDFYVDLTDYLDKANPYLKNKAAWKTVYNEGELATTQASNGRYYYIDLEKIPVCFMYNKTLLAEAGVTNPNSISTYEELLAAMDKVDEYISVKPNASEYTAYTTTYTWYQIAMECNLFSDMVPLGDVLRKNNMVDTEEMCRLFDKKIWKPNEGINESDNTKSNLENNRFYEYIKLIERLDSHKAPFTYAAHQGWLAGKVAFLETTGAQLRSLSTRSGDAFEWGTIAFPDITTTTTPNGNKGVVRGSAGLATSWWVSNSAVDAGTVDACVDLLMYLTAPEQNNKLIGDLKGGIPLNPTADFELAPYLKPLVEQYNADIIEANAGNRVYWGSFNCWSVLGESFSNSFIRAMQDLDQGTKTAEAVTHQLAKAIRQTIAAYELEYDFDTTKW